MWAGMVGYVDILRTTSGSSKNKGIILTDMLSHQGDMNSCLKDILINTILNVCFHIFFYQFQILVEMVFPDASILGSVFIKISNNDSI